MKRHITVEQLVKIGAENILTLSNHKDIDTVWMGWDSPEKINDAIFVYGDKGWQHSSLISTAKRCDVAALLEILKEKCSFSIETFDSGEDTTWVCYITHIENDEKQVFQEPNLCDALWDAVVRFYF